MTHRPFGPENAFGPPPLHRGNRRKACAWRFPEEDVMRNLYSTERLFEDLFGLHRGFNEMFNRALAAKPWGRELREFQNAFTFVPAVEAYVDKEVKRYICRATLRGVDLKELEIQAQGNLLTIRGQRKFEHRAKEAEFFGEEIAYGMFERTI